MMLTMGIIGLLFWNGESMSQTNSQKLRRQKKQVKARAKAKRRNIEHNLAPVSWRLDVLHGGRWVEGFRSFRKWTHVERHISATEALRENGAEVIAGRVVSLETGKIVAEIAPSPPKPQGKGTLPDKLANDPEGANKGILGRILR